MEFKDDKLRMKLSYLLEGVLIIFLFVYAKLYGKIDLKISKNRKTVYKICEAKASEKIWEVFADFSASISKIGEEVISEINKS